MSDYLGTAILDVMIGDNAGDNVGDMVGDNVSILSEPQEYTSFFGGIICTRTVIRGDIYINYHDIYFNYLGTKNDISYWGCDEADFCICVDENLRIFTEQPTDIIREKNIDGLDSMSRDRGEPRDRGVPDIDDYRESYSAPYGVPDIMIGNSIPTS